MDIQEQPGLELWDPVTDATSGLIVVHLNKEASSKDLQTRPMQTGPAASEQYTHSTPIQPGLELAVSPQRAPSEQPPFASSMPSNSVELTGTISGTTIKEQGITILNKHQEQLGENKWRSLKGKFGGSKRRSGVFASSTYSDPVLTAALEEAATMGSLPLVEFFISQGSDVNYTSPLAKGKDGTVIMDDNKQRNRALNLAIAENHLPIVEYLCTQCDQVQLSCRLLTAVEYFRKEIAKLLVRSGDDANFMDDERCSLELAIGNEHSLEMRKELLDILNASNRLNVDTLIHGAKPPLMFALSRGRRLEAMWLLRAGANVALVGTDGGGPLHVACKQTDAEWTHQLLDSGASPTARTKTG